MRTIIPCNPILIPVLNQSFNINCQSKLTFHQTYVKSGVNNLIGNTQFWQIGKLYIAFSLSVAVNIAYIQAAHIICACVFFCRK